ncbi:MAG: terminase small subunit [Erysipelotrichaceae bacterium]|nr:terminase small subunit [Erysipelotrichaceae bacterium]
MTDKQRRFCEEYLKDRNATQAAIRAGYSKRTAKQIGNSLLQNKESDLWKYIQQETERLKSEAVADAQEIMEFLTSDMRGEKSDEVLAMDGTVVQLKAPTKDRIKAADSLGTRYGMWTDRKEINVQVPVFEGEDDIPD